PPARGQQREISYLCWNNFAPASDKKLAEIGQRFTRDTGIKLKIDHVSHMGPQQAKYASEVQTQAGHDLVEMRMHFPWLYEPQLVDVSDVVGELEKKYGKAISSAYEGAHVNGVWRAVPQYHGMFVATYREDLFKKASLKVPDTWEDLYTVGKELKKMGNPVGIPISQNYDSISTTGASAAPRAATRPTLRATSASGNSRRTSSPPRSGSATCSASERSTTSTSCRATRSICQSTTSSKTIQYCARIPSTPPSEARGSSTTPMDGRRRPRTRSSSSP